VVAKSAEAAGMGKGVLAFDGVDMVVVVKRQVVRRAA